jgi:hypothetical protein
MSKRLADVQGGSLLALPDSSVTTVVLRANSTSVVPGVRAASFDVRVSGPSVTITGLDGPVRLLDATGRAVRTVASQGRASVALPHSGLWIVDGGTAGRRSVVVP